MKIKIVVIDLELSRRAKRMAAIAAVPLLVLAGGAIAYANLTTPLKTWKAGDTLTVADLNAQFGNMTALDTRLTALESKTAALKNTSTYSVGATYCGTGPTVGTGAINYNSKTGYAGAKAMCEASVGCASSKTAHICTGEEIARSLALGIASPTKPLWYSTAATIQTSTTSGNDCNGWTDNGATGAIGQTWESAGLSYSKCSDINAVACCD